MIDSSLPVLEASGLVKDYDRLRAVDHLDFRVYRGDIYGFLGPNGSGKSTSIRMILTLVKPTEGNIQVFGKELTTNRKYILSRIGALIEKPDFYNYLSAYENMSILSRYGGLKPDKKHIMALLEMVGLEERAHSRVKTYSQGMRQRLGIAQTLLHNPELIILDEPTNGLDPQGIHEMRSLIMNLNKEKGITFIISSHILKEMELISNRMIVINKGKKIVEGGVQELMHDSRQRMLLETSDQPKALELLKTLSYISQIEHKANGELEFSSEATEAGNIAGFLSGYGLLIYRLQPLNSLEEFFLNIT